MREEGGVVDGYGGADEGLNVQATDLLKLPPPFHTLSLTHKHTLRPPSLSTTQPSKRVRGVTPCLFLSLGVCRLQSGGWRARYSSNRLQFETGFKYFS
ncbi:hypothetical protein L2E82_16835 [Cichorium intybus]|uniref:Uncharacterized protein n=1 Tax=Cichorium intybus TaxID=13427 RepID=A0ACB9F642_CICIN|nr:hypothetical protein L2E82_16835 [Cichorium intybus]